MAGSPAALGGRPEVAVEGVVQIVGVIIAAMDQRVRRLIGNFLFEEGLSPANVLRGAISQLDDTQLAPASYDALIAFGDALPKARGALIISMHSERGIGALQLGASLNRLAATAYADAPDTLIGEALALLLSGAMLTVEWQPHL